MAGQCATCKQPVAPAEGLRAGPFCSERCRTIDLGLWVDGAYRIAGSDEAADPDALEAGLGSEGD